MKTRATHRPGGGLTWSLCLPTLNRDDILRRSVRHALEQSVPPLEIIIIDAGDHWEQSRELIEEIVAGTGVRLFYEAAEKKSSCVQRNRAGNLASGDILFFFDDDTLMHPGCAEALLDAYAADTEGRVGAIAAVNTPEPPAFQNAPRPGVQGDRGTVGADRFPALGVGEDAVIAKRVATVSRRHRILNTLIARSGLVRYLLRNVLTLSTEGSFVPYDAERARSDFPIPAALERLKLRKTRHIEGYCMSVRRRIFLDEPFDPYLLAYCPAEDLDASYRWGRLGLNLICPQAKVHHYEAASGRLKRAQVAELTMLNIAYFLRRNSDAPARHIAQFYGRMLRRLPAELFKDLYTARFGLPQFRATGKAVAGSIGVFTRSRDDLTDWYMSRQRAILDRHAGRRSGASDG